MKTYEVNIFGSIGSIGFVLRRNGIAVASSP
jgi:hypothetical protein